MKMLSHVIFVCIVLLYSSAIAQKPNDTDTLKQYAADLQESPDNQALREKIIKLALTMNHKPSTPDEAIMHEGAGEYAFKNAKANSDYSDAAKEYEKALLLAPWVAEDYFNCGVAHEKAGENKGAIRNFNLYLLAAPTADDATAVKRRIGGLQFAQQKVDEQLQQRAQAAQDQRNAEARAAEVERIAQAQAQQASNAQQQRDEEWSKKLAGIWRLTAGNMKDYAFYGKPDYRVTHYTFSVRNSCLIVTYFNDKNGRRDSEGNQLHPEGESGSKTYLLSGHSADASLAETGEQQGTRIYRIADDFNSVTYTRIYRRPGMIDETSIYTRVDDPKLISSRFK